MTENSSTGKQNLHIQLSGPGSSAFQIKCRESISWYTFKLYKSKDMWYHVIWNFKWGDTMYDIWYKKQNLDQEILPSSSQNICISTQNHVCVCGVGGGGGCCLI